VLSIWYLKLFLDVRLSANKGSCHHYLSPCRYCCKYSY